jgi:hypothetical protein
MRLFAPLDAVIIAVLLACSLAFVPFVNSLTRSTVVVYRDNTPIARYPLTTDKVFTAAGDIGPMTIEIRAGKVRVLSSTCDRRICARTAPISQPLSQIACVPNHILIEIGSEKEPNERVDAVAK